LTGPGAYQADRDPAEIARSCLTAALERDLMPERVRSKATISPPNLMTASFVTGGAVDLVPALAIMLGPSWDVADRPSAVVRCYCGGAAALPDRRRRGMLAQILVRPFDLDDNGVMKKRSRRG
jgi:hypothetical protein